MINRAEFFFVLTLAVLIMLFPIVISLLGAPTWIVVIAGTACIITISNMFIDFSE